MAHYNFMELAMKGMKFICAILAALVYVGLLPGCAAQEPAPMPAVQIVAPGGNSRVLTSPAPVAANHKAYAQLVEQSGEHWRDMAAEVAERTLKAYEDREDILARPLYLPPPNNRPFSVAFYHLLRTELVSRGLQVSNDREACSVLLEYWVQTVPFDAGRLDGALRSGRAVPSASEIIVSARMFYRNRFVMHCSQVRYINEKDLALYLDPQSFDPQASSSRHIRITGK